MPSNVSRGRTTWHCGKGEAAADTRSGAQRRRCTQRRRSAANAGGAARSMRAARCRNQRR
jgi:hypothetical protein